MLRRVFKVLTLVVALGFVAAAVMAAGGGRGQPAPPAALPKAKTAAVDAGAADAGATDAGATGLKALFGGDDLKYLPASKSMGGPFMRGPEGTGTGLGGLGLRTPEVEPQPPAPAPAPKK